MGLASTVCGSYILFGMGFVDFLTQDQASQLMQGVSDDRDRALLLVGLTVGTTVSELMQLTVDAINWDARQITIPGKRQRTLPLIDFRCHRSQAYPTG